MKIGRAPDSDLKKLATALGLPTTGRTRVQLTADIQAAQGGAVTYATKALALRGRYGKAASFLTVTADESRGGGVARYYWTGTYFVFAGTNESAPTPPPTQPTLTATPGASSVALSWGITNGPLTSQTLSRTISGVTVALSVTSSATSYSDSGLTVGVPASYSLIQSNGTGDSPAGTVTATPTGGSAPPAPSNFTATSGAGQNTLAWPNPGSLTGVSLTRAPAFSSAPSLAANATGYTDSTAVGGTSYTYSLTFANATGSSTAATASATPTAGTATVYNVSDRNIEPIQLSSGTQQQANRVRQHLIRQATDLQWEWINWYANAGDFIGANDYYLTAALEVYNQTSTPDVYPLTFAGLSGVKVTPGSSTKNDALNLTLPAGSTVFLRQHVSVAGSAQTFPLTTSPYAAKDEGTFASAQTLTVDTAGAAINATSIPLTLATTRAIPAGVSLLFGTTLVTTSAASAIGVTALPVNAISAAIASGVTASHFDPTLLSATFTRAASSNTPYFGPIRMIGTAAGSTASTVIIGDSIPAGLSDGSLNANGTTAVAIYEYGFARRALNGSNRPTINLSRGSERLQSVTAGTGYQYRLPYIRSGDIVWMLYGANDLNTRSFAQFKADVQTMSTAVRGRGATLVMCTVLPRTTSTDAWATTANQTPLAGFEAGGSSTRGQVNAWIRAGADGLHDGYVETADWVESARDSGVWKASGWTADGVHPSNVGNVAISEGLTSAERLRVGAPATPYGFNLGGLVGRYLFDEASGSTLTDTGMYAAYAGSLNTATRNPVGGLTFTSGQTATLPATLTTNINGRTSFTLTLAFNKPASLPSADTVLLSATGLTVKVYGTGNATHAGKVEVTLGASISRSAAAIAAGDHTVSVNLSNGYLIGNVDGFDLPISAYSGAVSLSGQMVLGGFGIHAFLAYGDGHITADIEIAHRSLRQVLNARSGVALP